MCFVLSYSHDDKREETNQKHIVFETTTIVLLCLPHFIFDNLLINQGRAVQKEQQGTFRRTTNGYKKKNSAVSKTRTKKKTAAKFAAAVQILNFAILLLLLV